MVTTTGSIDEVRGLVAERQRYDDWLTALEAKREATPAHVFERVEKDYRARRDDVTERLSGHFGMLQSLRDDLQSKLETISSELSELEDARMEALLRTEVGEFDDDHWEEARADVESGISEKTATSAGISASLAEVRELLDSAGFAAVEADAEDVAEGDGSEWAVGVSVEELDADAVESSVDSGELVESEAGAASAEAAVAHEGSRDEAHAEADGEADELLDLEEAQQGAEHVEASGEATSDTSLEAPMDIPEHVVSVSQFTVDGAVISVNDDILPVTEAPSVASGAAPAFSPESVFGGDPLAGSDESEQLRSGAAGAGATADDAFDDLAFLRSVVDSGLSSAAGGGSAGVTEQQKTLRCTECGTMNLPTEWYCERCGGELAAF